MATHARITRLICIAPTVKTERAEWKGVDNEARYRRQDVEQAEWNRYAGVEINES